MSDFRAVWKSVLKPFFRKLSFPWSWQQRIWYVLMLWKATAAVVGGRFYGWTVPIDTLVKYFSWNAICWSVSSFLLMYKDRNVLAPTSLTKNSRQWSAYFQYVTNSCNLCSLMQKNYEERAQLKLGAKACNIGMQRYLVHNNVAIICTP